MKIFSTKTRYYHVFLGSQHPVRVLKLFGCITLLRWKAS